MIRFRHACLINHDSCTTSGRKLSTNFVTDIFRSRRHRTNSRFLVMALRCAPVPTAPAIIIFTPTLACCNACVSWRTLHRLLLGWRFCSGK